MNKPWSKNPANQPSNIVTYVKSFVDNKSIYLTPYMVSGRLNNEYIRGNQYQRINRRTLAIEDRRNTNPSVYTERKTFNRILPIYLTRYGILTDNMPFPGFKPTAIDATSVTNAIVGNEFIKEYINTSNYVARYNRLVQHQDVYGLGWVKTGIDWSQGEAIAEVDIDLETATETSKGSYTVREGRVFDDFVPMNEVFVDSLYVDTMDQVNELVHRRPFSLAYIRKRFGIEAKAEDVSDRMLVSSPQYSSNAISSTEMLEYAYVYEYYKKADAVYPEGRFTMIINDSIVYDGKLPFVNAAGGKRVIPFDLVKPQSVPNYLVGVTTYQQILPIQDTYNAVKNRYLEYVNHIAIGQLYVWENSLVNKETFSTKPGRLIGLKRNARPPQPVQKDKLSMEFINYLRTLEDDMLIASGLSQMAAYGAAKSNVRTDGVVDKIGESDQNKLTNTIDNISEMTKSVFKKLLYLEQSRQKKLLEEMAIAKKDSNMLKFKLKDINPEEVVIVNRDFLMQDDQILEKKMSQAAGMGVYNPQMGLSYLSKLEILDAMNSNYLKDTLDPVERATHDLVSEEHMNLLDGEFPKAEGYHKHDQHLMEHNLFRISPEVRKLKKDDKEQYELLMEALDEHIKQHEGFGKDVQQQGMYQNAKAFL